MKWLLYALLASEVIFAGCAILGVVASGVAVLLLAFNSVLLIWSFARWRRRPSCCR